MENLLWVLTGVFSMAVFWFLLTFAIQIYEGRYVDLAFRKARRSAVMMWVALTLIALLSFVLGMIYAQVRL